ncbi:MAG: tetratricopeptide repeat protein, partial [Anaerolineae bacterium]|nr:tetratricopeptide repeat protein [Anaerolineae bacterium]
MLNRVWWAVLAVAMLGLLLLSGPYVLSAHYLEQGVHLLVRAPLAEEHSEEGNLGLEPQPPTQSLAAEALARFQAAIAADPGNFQAYRWLGRAALALDRPEEAVVAFSTAARLRPANPLAWWDLGLAYGRLASSSDFSVLESADTPALAPASSPAIINTLSPTPALIPAIAVNAAPFTTGYTTTWSLPDAPDAWPAWWVPPDPVQRVVLLFSPPGQISFRVSLPMTSTVLLFWMGMDPLLQTPRGDGVVYRVQVEGAEVFRHTLRPEAAHGGWWPAQVDLTLWAGRTVSLTLILDPGPAGDAEGDRAGW